MKAIKRIFVIALCVMILSGVLPSNQIERLKLLDFSLTVSALDESNYTYTVSNNEATITNFLKSYSGSLIIPNTLGGYPVTSIGSSAFDGCENLTSVSIPDTVTSIGSNAFSYCLELKSIEFGDRVTSIGSSAFRHCIKLTSITIPKSVTFIGDGAFGVYLAYNEKMTLEKVNITDISAWSNIEFETCDSNPLYCGAELYLNNELVSDLSVPNDVTKISDYAFIKAKGIESVTIPDSVLTIGESAFSYCPDLTKVVIGDGVQSLTKCFNDCSKLREVIIGNGVKDITTAFNNCTELKDITFGSSVETLDEMAFSGCISIEKVHLPASVKFIGGLIPTFVTCIKLNEITVDDANQTYRAEGNCLIEIATNKIVLGCNKSVIPNDVKRIGHYAFAMCPELETIHIPATVTEIGYYQSMLNTKLTSLTVDKNNSLYRSEGNCIITKETNEVVWGSINSVIPEGVKSIGGAAFNAIGTIESVYIPASVTHIKQEAFNRNEIKKVYYGGTQKQKESINIEGYNRPLDAANWHYEVTCINGHKPVVFKGYAATCAKTGLTDGKKCSVCGKTIVARKTIGKSTHTYTRTTTKATLSKNGSIIEKCTVCGKVASNTAIKYAKTFKLSTTTYTYDGKAKTPSVTVKDSAGKTLKKNTDYTVTYASGRKNVGTYKVTIKMIGKYSGTKTLTFKINPAKTTVSKLTAGKKSITVAIAKKSTQVTGYQIQYSTSKSFSKATTKTISSYKTTKYTLKSLSAKKTYYVRVRTYKTVGKTKYYSGWSTYKYVKTK